VGDQGLGLLLHRRPAGAGQPIRQCQVSQVRPSVDTRIWLLIDTRMSTPNDLVSHTKVGIDTDEGQ
jgi:hypothetical protein